MSSDLSPLAVTWINDFAEAIGQPPIRPDEIEALLNLAGVAAHASHRQAAPVACWLAARAGLPPTEALRIAQDLPGRALPRV